MRKGVCVCVLGGIRMKYRQRDNIKHLFCIRWLGESVRTLGKSYTYWDILQVALVLV